MNTLQPVLDFYKNKGGEKAWCQKAMALDANDLPVRGDSPSAKRWCLARAVHASVNKKFLTKMFCELHARVGNYIIDWNDTPRRTYEKVVTVLSQDDLFSDLDGETRKHYRKRAIYTIKITNPSTLMIS